MTPNAGPCSKHDKKSHTHAPKREPELNTTERRARDELQSYLVGNVTAHGVLEATKRFAALVRDGERYLRDLLNKVAAEKPIGVLENHVKLDVYELQLARVTLDVSMVAADDAWKQRVELAIGALEGKLAQRAEAPPVAAHAALVEVATAIDEAFVENVMERLDALEKSESEAAGDQVDNENFMEALDQRIIRLEKTMADFRAGAVAAIQDQLEREIPGVKDAVKAFPELSERVKSLEAKVDPDCRYWAKLKPSATPPSGGPFKDAPVIMTPGILAELEEEDARVTGIRADTGTARGA